MNNSIAKIIVTLGPSSQSKEILQDLISAGMDFARINFSYGDNTQHLEFIHNLRQVAQSLNKNVPIIADLSGPRVSNGETHQLDSNAASILTPKDVKDLEFIIDQKIEYVALSYVGSAGDILMLKDKVKELGGNQLVIAKIERVEALNDLDSIIEDSDGVMIARGDLGNEVALERIPFIERSIIHKSNRLGKMVITATQMMLSMVDSLSPTRADVTDVAFAVINGSDCLMLSEETAVGRFPVEAVTMMKKIILEAEKHQV